MSGNQIVHENPWLNIYRERPDALVRLICFPHAGSSAAAFGTWADSLPATIEAIAVEYPGRGTRRSEAPFVRLHALVAALLSGVRTHLVPPFAIMGHCVGALIGFELARQLHRHGGPLPVALFAIGCRGPRRRARKAPVFALPEADFVEELRSLTGTDPAILENRDLLRLFLPTLRADFEMADTYACRHSGTLPLPIFAYGGEHDDEIPREDLDAWALETDRPLVVRVYPGQHFFIRAEDRRVLDDVAHDLLGVLSPVEAGVPGGHGG